MEVRRLNALHKLAKDILQSDPVPHEPNSPKVTLDETLFQDKETNKISLTLKNYERPNGVATQIFDVDLIGYEKDEDDKSM